MSGNYDYAAWVQACENKKRSLEAQGASTSRIFQELKALNSTTVNSSGQVAAFSLVLNAYNSKSLNLSQYSMVANEDAICQIIQYFGQQPHDYCLNWSRLYAECLMALKGGGSVRQYQKSPTSLFSSNKQSMLAIMRDEVLAGRPVVLYVNGHASGRHFVNCMGIKDSAINKSASQLREDDFIIMDPASPEIKPLNVEGYAGVGGAANTARRYLKKVGTDGNKDNKYPAGSGNEYCILVYGNASTYTSKYGANNRKWNVGAGNLSYTATRDGKQYYKITPSGIDTMLNMVRKGGGKVNTYQPTTGNNDTASTTDNNKKQDTSSVIKLDNDVNDSNLAVTPVSSSGRRSSGRVSGRIGGVGGSSSYSNSSSTSIGNIIRQSGGVGTKIGATSMVNKLADANILDLLGGMTNDTTLLPTNIGMLDIDTSLITQQLLNEKAKELMGTSIIKDGWILLDGNNNKWIYSSTTSRWLNITNNPSTYDATSNDANIGLEDAITTIDTNELISEEETTV